MGTAVGANAVVTGKWIVMGGVGITGVTAGGPFFLSTRSLTCSGCPLGPTASSSGYQYTSHRSAMAVANAAKSS